MDNELFRQLAIKSFDNAQELYEEAKILYDNKHYSRCVFLSQIGAEELGKHCICSSDYVNSLLSKFDEKKFNSRFRNHRKKLSAITNAEDFWLDIFHNRIENGLFLNSEPDIEVLEQIKLSSLYVDFKGNDSIKPSDVYDKKFAKSILDWLLNRIKLFKKINVISRLRDGKLDNIDSINKLKELTQTLSR